MKSIKYIILVVLFAHLNTHAGADEKSKSAKNAQNQIAGLDESNLPNNFKVKTSDNEILPLPKVLINKFDLIKKALENDKDEREIPLPGVSAANFIIISGILYNAQTDALNNFDQIKNRIQNLVDNHNINGIYKSADYLGIDPNDPLFAALTDRYAQIIHEYLQAQEKLGAQEKNKLKPNLIAQAQNIPNAKYYLPLIAKQYFLLFTQDIDKELGVISRPSLEELKKYRLLTDNIINQFSNLEKDPNQVNQDNRTALGEAIFLDDLNAVKALLKLGARADLKGQNHLLDVVLHDKKNQIPIATLLINAGAPLNQETNSTNPLLAAIRATKKELVKLLVENGADITQEVLFATPLIQAKVAIPAILKEIKAMEPLDKEENEYYQKKLNDSREILDFLQKTIAQKRK